jgi:hypothetical protein
MKKKKKEFDAKQISMGIRHVHRHVGQARGTRGGKVDRKHRNAQDTKWELQHLYQMLQERSSESLQIHSMMSF